MAHSFIDVWHGFGSITGYVSHDGDTGNAASTFLELDFGESQLPTINVENDEFGYVRKLSLHLNGSCERWGLAELLRAAGEELRKPLDQLGQRIEIGHEPFEEDQQLSIAEKGLVGEAALNSWLQSTGISYLYINQSPDTFANLFKGALKRPDFLVLFESVGMIAVDAKNYTLFNDEYSLPLEAELRRVLTFERLFRIPVWYAYLSQETGNSTVWYWISALKALEVGQVKKNSKTGDEFLAIKLCHFERIERGEDLAKLYTHRLPSLKKIANES